MKPTQRARGPGGPAAPRASGGGAPAPVRASLVRSAVADGLRPTLPFSRHPRVPATTVDRLSRAEPAVPAAAGFGRPASPDIVSAARDGGRHLPCLPSPGGVAAERTPAETNEPKFAACGHQQELSAVGEHHRRRTPREQGAFGVYRSLAAGTGPAALHPIEFDRPRGAGRGGAGWPPRRDRPVRPACA